MNLLTVHITLGWWHSCYSRGGYEPTTVPITLGWGHSCYSRGGYEPTPVLITLGWGAFLLQ
jgi:hypothetical protein